MTPARFQTIEEIFLGALEQEPDQVNAFLERACDGDAVLRREVEALLASDQRADRFIETSSVGLTTKVIQNQQVDSLVGRTIGHYKISESIGTGGMGEVYLATDITAGRKAALKLLPLRFTGDAERLKRFQREARAVVGLNHPNILTVYEIGEDHSTHYIASELIEGETLRQRLTRGQIQVGEAVDVAIQVVNALVAAHETGIVHRDIKPENIMLRPDGYVKVLDFGIAKLAEQQVPPTTPRDEALSLVETNLGAVLGTVRYMSPEQACGAPVDKRTDIWSLGVVLYEMVTGNAPFIGDTPQDVMSSILEKEPSPLTRHVAHVPAELQQIISKTLRKDRRQRYPSAHELLEALKDLRHKLEVEAELERSTAAAQAELQMAAEMAKQMALEIGHVLFVDIVSYSQLSINEQHAAIAELTQTVRSTEQFRKAGGADRLIKIATGDGMALVFYTSPEAPVRCAMEISRALKQHPRLRIRMGIHSGPVSGVVDVTGRTNLAGAGLNLARRVMDCGDAGHILLSKHVAEDLSEFEEWRPMLHELGTCEVKHGMQVHVFNLHTDELGNSRLPEKLKQSRHEKDAAASVAQKRIAVLPFKPVLPESRDLVLELGMADTLITKLSNSREIIVRSLTSVRKYGGLEQDPVSAGRELEVNSVLEGNVQRVGDRIRVTARLIKVADGSSLWSATFDEKFTDVFSVQDAISQKVADALALRLSREENKRLTKRYTDNVEAYQLYLTGLYHWNKLTLPEIRKSIGFFNQAIDLDPTYALAYFGLAYAYVAFGPMSDMPPKDVLPQGKAAATKALEIDESLAEAHGTLAFIHTLFDWDWAEAEKEAKRAIALNPNLALAHMAYAELLSVTGRRQEAITEGTRAQELDPLSLIINTLHGSFLYYARRNDEATSRLQKTIELDPNFWLAYLILGKIYFNKGKYPEAIAEFSKATELSGGNSEPISMTGYAWAMAGDPAKARAVLKELKSLSSQRYVPGTSLGALCYAVGEKDEAFTWLEQAYEDRDLRLSRLKVDPKWDAMRSEPRFVAILKRIGLQ